MITIRYSHLPILSEKNIVDNLPPNFRIDRQYLEDTEICIGWKVTDQNKNPVGFISIGGAILQLFTPNTPSWAIDLLKSTEDDSESVVMVTFV